MKQKQSELVRLVQDLAIEKGRTPTRDEFTQTTGISRHHINLHFGSWVTLVQAAGLDQNNHNKRIDSSIFNVDLEKHLENYKPREKVDYGPYPTMAIISDIHWPFENKKVIDAFLKYVEENKPEWVIINGDGWDMYSHSKFPRSHNVFTPKEEQRLAREKNENFWQLVKKKSPKSKCVQMLGNHDIRPMRRVLEAYPEAEDWVAEKMKKLFSFKGVKTFFDYREELYIREDIAVFHGYKTKLGDHRDYTLCSTFNGHTHHGGTVFKNLRSQVIFECNSGFAGDPESKGLSYTSQKTTTQTPGFAACDKWGPRFIPL